MRVSRMPTRTASGMPVITALLHPTRVRGMAMVMVLVMVMVMVVVVVMVMVEVVVMVMVMKTLLSETLDSIMHIRHH